MVVSISRIRKQSRALTVAIPCETLKQLCWKVGDAIAFRVAGEKCVMERLPLERMAVIRTGEATPNQ
jgi:antitoxin component of MazEF toxin-antitoxin module